jgi:hypothetical protein
MGGVVLGEGEVVGTVRQGEALDGGAEAGEALGLGGEGGGEEQGKQDAAGRRRAGFGPPCQGSMGGAEEEEGVAG